MEDFELYKSAGARAADRKANTKAVRDHGEWVCNTVVEEKWKSRDNTRTVGANGYVVGIDAVVGYEWECIPVDHRKYRGNGAKRKLRNKDNYFYEAKCGTFFCPCKGHTNEREKKGGGAGLGCGSKWTERQWKGKTGTGAVMEWQRIGGVDARHIDYRYAGTSHRSDGYSDGRIIAVLIQEGDQDHEDSASDADRTELDFDAPMVNDLDAVSDTSYDVISDLSSESSFELV